MVIIIAEELVRIESMTRTKGESNSPRLNILIFFANLLDRKLAVPPSNSKSKNNFNAAALLLLMVCSICIALTLLREPQQLAYMNATDGEYWRWLSGHFVHNNIAHLAMNLAALLSLFWLGLPLANLACLLLLLPVLALLNSVFLFGFYPELQWYVGLSGVLHGLAAMIGIGLWQQRDKTGLLLFIGLLLKLLWEQSGFYHGGSTAELIGVRVATEAHLGGGIAGLLLLFIRFCWQKAKAGAQNNQQHYN